MFKTPNNSYSQLDKEQSPPSCLLGSSPPQPSDLSKAVARWQEMQSASLKTVPVTVLKDLNKGY